MVVGLGEGGGLALVTTALGMAAAIRWVKGGNAWGIRMTVDSSTWDPAAFATARQLYRQAGILLEVDHPNSTKSATGAI